MNGDSELSFDEWLENTSQDLSEVFELMRWKCLVTDGSSDRFGIPSQSEIKSCILRLINVMKEKGADNQSSNRIRLEYDKAVDGLSVYLDFDSYENFDWTHGMLIDLQDNFIQE
jgi:hypothetical protein